MSLLRKTFPRSMCHAVIVTFLIAISYLITAPTTISALEEPCEEALDLPLGTRLQGFLEERTELAFRLELPTSGIVVVDLTTIADRENLARLDLSQDRCNKATAVTVLERTPTHLALAVRSPGILFLRAQFSRDLLSRSPDSSYRVSSRFAPAQVLDEIWTPIDTVDHSLDVSQQEIGERLTMTHFFTVGASDKSDPVEYDPDPGNLLPPLLPPPPSTTTGSSTTDLTLLATIVTLRSALASSHQEIDGDPTGSPILEHVFFYRPPAAL